ncbi:Uncharacterised protein [Mycobacteroides abscessus subsp. abscessus]|nr:Uncharacterised protein [Mycobacteroides abscessus subsp. abscessus]
MRAAASRVARSAVPSCMASTKAIISGVTTRMASVRPLRYCRVAMDS